MTETNSKDNNSLNGTSTRKPQDRQYLIENGKGRPPTYGEVLDPPSVEEKPKTNAVPIRQMFRFATKTDMFLLVIGTICALANGAAWPLMLVILADTVDSLVIYRKLTLLLDEADGVMGYTGLTRKFVYDHVDKFVPLCPDILAALNYTAVECSEFDDQLSIFDDMKDQAAQYAYVGIAVLICAYGQVLIFMTTSERQVIKMRKAFYMNILKQNMAWFDKHGPGDLTVKMIDDIHHIHDAIGDKSGTAIQWFGSSIAGLAVAFCYGWKLSFVMISAAPALAITFGFMAKVTGSMTTKERDAYAKAGSVAEEVFSSIRTVAAFGGQEKEAKRYKENLIQAQHYGIKKGRLMGLSVGTAWCVIYCFLSIGFYYGGSLVRHDEYKVKDAVVVFLASLIGSFSIGFASPAFTLVKVGSGAAYEVFRIIDESSEIDAMSTEGRKPHSVKGVIKLKNVHFSYPSRPTVKILDGFNLTVSPGQTVALVGHSGCGKSTITQLLMRFYDVKTGEVTIDGINVKDLNVKHLRQNIGIVSQEPVLFPTTIAENIVYGREGVTEEEVLEAAKKANAYDFIMGMPDGFNCYVGERGAQLSGGQKQRIAIARSLVREPRVLLLDEATSALDRTSEALVQDALDKASVGRTTLIIAHRLSTIRHADLIVVMEKGRVMEQGTHESLMEDEGLYYNMVNARKLSDEEEDDAKKKDYDADEEYDDTVRALKRSVSLTNEEKIDEEVKMKNREAIRRIWHLTAPEWCYNLIGCFASLFNGGIQPIWGYLLAETLIVYTDTDKDEQKKEMNNLSYYCLGLAATSLISYTSQHYSFGVSGERLIGRIRSIAFKAMLRQEIGWFDEEKNQSAILSAQLAEKATLVKGAVQSICMSALLSVGVLASAFTISFIFSWKLTMVTGAFVPVIILAGFMTVKEMQGMSDGHKSSLEDASNEAMTAVSNIRTVASLTKESLFFEKFCISLDECFESNVKATLMMGSGLAISLACYYFTFSATFYYGAVLLEDDDIDGVDVFRVFNCIVLSTVQLGKMVAVAPDTKGALKAAKQIFALADSVPAIDPYSKAGHQPDPKSIRSAVRFSNVHFRYPMRPEAKVLGGLNVHVDSGEMLALVGESGSGKSTVVQLLERFYSPQKGQVFFDKYDISSLNVQWLRQQIGLVSQEPVLFDTSISENIAYGDNSRIVGMDEIISAAKAAYIHSFIQSLPQGYETNVGSKGTQLSGGQKQRIAIARALVRNPKILLLDEATSALDPESEKIVQDALDKAREGRTCITIAHRLSTIKHSNKIAVIRNGMVHEQGTHAQLINKKAIYYDMITQT